MMAARGKSLQCLAIELNMKIAGYLDDETLCAFSAVCRASHEAVTSAHSSVWREQFSKYFEIPDGKDNDWLKVHYQYRRNVLLAKKDSPRRRTTDDARKNREKSLLLLLRELINQSYTGNLKLAKDTMSLNLVTIAEAIHRHDFLKYPDAAWEEHQNLFHTLRVVLSHLMISLKPSLRTRSLGFADSQIKAYADPFDAPVFTGPHRTVVNMSWIFQVLNFFKCHFTGSDEFNAHAFRALPESQHLQAWYSALGQELLPLGRRWMGSYAYMSEDDLRRIRNFNRQRQDYLCDSFPGDGEEFHDLYMEFPVPDPRGCPPWPRIFEEHLKSKTHRSVQSRAVPAFPSSSTAGQSIPAPPIGALPRAPQTVQPVPVLQFAAVGYDQVRFLASGCISNLPSQSRIPGWRRFTMMKYKHVRRFPLDLGAPLYEEPEPWPQDVRPAEEVRAQEPGTDIDDEDMWAYEGVVIPGGQVIVGRFWRPLQENPGRGVGEVGYVGEGLYTGPFVFWCVDG